MTILQAGPLRAVYSNGFLRRISYGETEIVRMIYFALRDENWNTFEYRIENEDVVRDSNNFGIVYDCYHVDGDSPVMQWETRIDGKEDGTIVFEITGVATKSIKTNRAGFCVLHPLSVIGQECRVIHPEGTETIHTFPSDIAADNPITEIQSMAFNTRDYSYTLDFEGDIFETEDQRNWGDASFKTFCTPLRKPTPVDLEKGQKVFQRITLRPSPAHRFSVGSSSEVILRDKGRRRILPSLGIAASNSNMDGMSASLIRSLGLNHYRIDLSPASDDFVIDFSRAYENAFAAGQALEVALHLTSNFVEEMEAFSVISKQNKVKLRKVVLFQSNALVTPQAIIDRAQVLKTAFPNVLVGAGTNYNFNELNKNRFDASNADFITFSMNPQEHAVDDLTILENAASLEHLVKSARSIYGTEMPVHISPVTLKKRFNPYARNPADLFIDEPKRTDPRQKEKIAAVWTFACIMSASEGGASAMTLFQSTGDQGIIGFDGRPYPVFEMLRQLTPYQRKNATMLESSDPLSICGMILDGRILALANLADERKKITWNKNAFELQPKAVAFLPLDRTQQL